MIETIELPELVLIGILVECPWPELSREVPAAWRRLFEAETGAQAFLEASLSVENGVYRELVGYLAARRTDVPEGMTKIALPAGRYLRSIHDGPLAGIAGGFGELLDHAKTAGLKATDLKLDFGYLPGLPDGRHELHVGLAAEPLRLFG
ncbi:GyrI-like domain-containing protein [Rhizobium sp. LjRoot254]|uniref:GyrI-like domain-containing protein n=1 Tax=Rhizobium sp. LjRoot254 TaxID=3342297 RepID=UPI003ECDF64D